MRTGLGGTRVGMLFVGLAISQAVGASWCAAAGISLPISFIGLVRPALVSPQVVPALDPLFLLDTSLERCRGDLDTYRCRFTKQERKEGRLTKVQEIDVAFREHPRSVDMCWVRNAGKVRRAIYVEGQTFDRKGEPCAVVEPSGALARLFAGEVSIPLNSEQARKASRLSIDQFGMESLLSQIQRVNRIAEERGELKLVYRGEGKIGGRPTYIIARDLPYSGDGGIYPDARLVLHLDQELLLPVGYASYADHDERELLASYTLTQLELNARLDHRAFDISAH